MSHQLRIIFSVICIMLAIPVHAATSYLTNIRIVKTDAATRIMFSLTQPTMQHVFTLQNPNRLVIDFEHTRLVERLNNLSLPANQIVSIRSGNPKMGVLRLVLETTSAIKYDVTPVGISKQFVVEVLSTQTKVAKKPTVVHAVRDREITVVIDAGHGGKDPGAVGIHGTKEKDVVLGIAKQLANLINQQPHTHAVLTRSGDYFVPLRDRLKLARKGKADLFIAIHADSYFDTQASGVSIYALSQRGATSEAARWLAKRDNTSELGGVDLGELQDQSYVLRSVLIDLAQTATITDSLHLGSSLLKSLDAVSELHYSRVEQAPFVVLKSPDIPSVLVETGFISNANEELLLRDYDYQNKIAQALFNGVRTYIKKYSGA